MADEGSNDPDTTAGYDTLAEHAEDLAVSPWGDSDYQRHYVWPAVRPLLPPTDGIRVLDAGCGIGDYTGWFLENGASVLGVDASRRAVSRARDRFGDRAAFRHGDLTDPLEFADSGTFDLVFCNLVLDHVADWRPVFEEFDRVLRRDGLVVFTTIHPMRRYRQHREELSSYYATEAYVNDWDRADTRIAHYHRSVEEIVDSLRDSDFFVEQLREPRPTEEYEQCNPDRYEEAMRRPDLLCVRASVSSPD